jgi:Tol biopolymer transport system component
MATTPGFVRRVVLSSRRKSSSSVFLIVQLLAFVIGGGFAGSAAAQDPPPLPPPPPGGLEAPWTHSTTTVNRNPDGTHGWGPSQSRGRDSMSRDGRYVLFSSDSPNLVANDTNNLQDVFIKDRQTGAVIRASVSSSGAQADGVSSPGSITPDGRWVVFQSNATNLVANDTNGKADLFVFDRLSRRTVLISHTPGRTPTNGDSFGPTISANGRYIAFVTLATNMGSTVSPSQVFFYDRDADNDGFFDEVGGVQITWLARGTNPSLNAPCGAPSMSADGRFVTFESDARDLVTNDFNNARDIFLVDRQTNITTRVNLGPGGMEAFPGTSSTSPMISANGQVVVFETDAPLAQDDYNGNMRDVFARDLATGETTLISPQTMGWIGPNTQPSVTEDGRFVLFHSIIGKYLEQSEWPLGTQWDSIRLFVYDRQLMTTTVASVGSWGRVTPMEVHEGFISGDGTTVTFMAPTYYWGGNLDYDTPQWGNPGDPQAYVSVPFAVSPIGPAPYIIDVPWDATETTLTVATTSVTRWTALSYDTYWLTVTPNPGLGSTTLTLHTPTNPSRARETTLLIGHLPLTIRQAENPEPLDLTPPVITATTTGPRVGDWFTGTVQVTWTIQDPESAVNYTDGCEPLNITTDSDSWSFTCTARSDGGTNAETIVVKRDTTPPMAHASVPYGVYDPGTSVNANFWCTDALSGVATCTSPVATVGQPFLFAGPPGFKSFPVDVTDAVGNVGTRSLPYAIGTGVCVASDTLPLVHWWSADSVVADMITGQLPQSTTAPAYATGRVDSAFSFDGGSHSQIIDVPNVGSLTGERSIAMWVMPKPYTPWNYSQTIVAGDGGFHIGLSSWNTLNFRLSPNESGWTIGTPVPVEPDVWTHLVVTFAPSGTTQTIVSAYMNGVKMYQGTLPGLIENGTSFLIGGERNTPPYSNVPYRGLLDELQIFSGVLSAQTVQDLYFAGGKGVCLTPQITWTPEPLVYGIELSAAQQNATANVPGTFAYNQAIGTRLQGGTQTLTGTFTPSAPRFATVPMSTTVAVAPAPLTIQANDARTIYQGPALYNSSTFTGFVYGETRWSLSGSLSYNWVNPNGDAGTFAIMPAGLTSTNYAITYLPGTLTIDKAPTTVRASVSAEPSIAGSTVTFRVTAGRGDFQYPGVPTGTVTLSEGEASLGQGTLTNGVATIDVSGLAPGVHTITVTYVESQNFLASTRVMQHEVVTELPAPAPAQRWDGFLTTVHRRADGSKAGAGSASPWYLNTISADGRYVAFVSTSPTLVPDDTNGVGDVFVKDRQTHEIERVSVGPGGANLSGTHDSPAISADGQHVLFVSNASILPSDVNGYPDVYLYDRARQTTVLISRRLDGVATNGGSYWPSISADGRFVTFRSTAHNILPMQPLGNAGGIFLHDRDTDADGVFDEPDAISIICVDMRPGGEAPAYNSSRFPSISADGRYVAFESSDNKLTSDDPNTYWDLFIYDRLAQETIRVPAPSTSNNTYMVPRLSSNGRFVAYTTYRAMSPSDTNQRDDVYVYDRATNESTPISLGLSVPGFIYNYGAQQSISADGRYILFMADIRSASTPSTARFRLFVFDRATGIYTQVADSEALRSSISGDGSTIVFEGLTPLDGDTSSQVYATVHFALTPPEGEVLPTGGQGTVGVTTTAVTNWGIAPMSTTGGGWITLTPANTIGSGTLDFEAAAMPASWPLSSEWRDGTIKVSARTVSVRQRAFPSIAGISPTHGPVAGGTSVTISGHGFVSPAIVTFGGTPAASVQVIDRTTIIASSPAGVGGTQVPVRVTIEGVESATSATFAYDDETAPTVSGLATGPTNASGDWFTGQVQIAWTIADPESAITSTSGCDPITINEDTTGRTFTCSATSAGGTNTATVTVKRDATPPTVRVQTPAGIYEPGDAVVVGYTCEDATSGVASCNGPIASGETQTMTAAAGTYEFQVVATDAAGRETTLLAPYAIATGACVPATTLPVASWWTGDQTTREAISGLDAVPPVAATYGPGKVGAAFVFDGASAVTLPGETADLGANRTLALWINPDSASTQEPGVFLSRAAGYALAVMPDRTLGYRLDASSAWTATNVRIDADRWTHLAIVFTAGSGGGSGASTQVQVYRDGLIADTQTIASDVVNSGALVFGGTAAAPSFAGRLDELQIFSTAFDAEAVRTLALTGNRGLCRRPTLAWTAAPLVYGTPLGAAQLNATADVAGTFEYSPVAGTVLPGAGAHTLAATFTPADPSTYGNASLTTTVNVTPAPLTIQALDAVKVFGAPLPVFAATGTGFVNGDTLASLAGTLQFATAATATSAVGTYPVAPSGLSSANYTITFAPGTLTIQPAATTTTVTASSSPSGLNEPVTFTARVLAAAPGAGVPTGTVAFSNGATLLGRGVLVNGEARLTTGGLGAGTKTISAQYEGDASFVVSSATLSHVVSSSSQSTSTALTASPNPANVGQTITLSATVSRSAGAVTGTVRFFDSGTLLGEAAIASGVARLTTSTLPAGVHALQAYYVGATNIPASQSPVVAVRVGSGGSRTPSLSWSVTPSTGTYGVESAFTLSIARSLGTSPTGTVQFIIDGLPPDPAHRVTVQVNGSNPSKAVLRLSTLPRGTHKISAVYLGDGTFKPGASVVTYVVQ